MLVDECETVKFYDLDFIGAEFGFMDWDSGTRYSASFFEDEKVADSYIIIWRHYFSENIAKTILRKLQEAGVPKHKYYVVMTEPIKRGTFVTLDHSTDCSCDLDK